MSTTGQDTVRTALQVLWLLIISAACVAIAGAIAMIPMAIVDLPFLIFKVDGFSSGPHPDATPVQIAGNIGVMAAFGALSALAWGGPAFLLTGLPLHALLRRRRFTALPVYIALGALTAPVSVNIIMMATTGALFAGSSLDDMLGLAPWFALAGAICAGLFRLMRPPPRQAVLLTPPPNAPT